MKYVFLLVLLSSCSSIQEATSVNVLKDESSHYDGIVKTVKSTSEAASCEFISNVKAEDNLMQLGREVAITNMKKFAAAKKANTVWVEECTETKTAISPIFTCSGKAYKCPNK